jgi:hypothetical protein
LRNTSLDERSTLDVVYLERLRCAAGQECDKPNNPQSVKATPEAALRRCAEAACARFP